MTVEDIYKILAKEIKHGNGDLPVVVSGDGVIELVKRFEGRPQGLPAGMNPKALKRRHRKNLKAEWIEFFGPMCAKSWYEAGNK